MPWHVLCFADIGKGLRCRECRELYYAASTQGNTG